MGTITRRRLVAGSATVAGAATLAATGLAGAAPAAPARPRNVAAQGKTEITVYHIWGTPPGGTPADTPSPMTQLIDTFNEQSGTVTVNSVTPSGTYYETLQKTQADIAAGNPPDLVSVPWAFLDYAVEGLGVKELTAIVGDSLDDLTGLLTEMAWQLVTKNDTVYGLPWGLSTPIIYYNADIFAEAGVDPGVAFTTWESFAAEAVKLQEALGGNPVLGLSYNKDWAAQTLIQSNGGRVMNDDGTFGITSDEAKAAMQTIADLDLDGLYDRGAQPEVRPNFVSGSTAVLQASVASLSGLRNEVPFTLGTSTWPQFGDKPVVSSTGGSFLGVFSGDPSRYEAITEFLAFCAGDVGYPIWNQMGYVNISNLELERLEGQDPAYEQFEQGLIRETNWPGPRGVEVGSTWDVYCARIWANDISVEEGVTQALAEITAITGQG